MSNYIKATNFATKDTLASGNPNKIVKGTEIDAEFTAIASAVSSKANINAPVFTGSVTLPGAPTTGLHAATKDYVDTTVGTLGTMASQNASSVAITGGSITKASLNSILEGATVTASAPTATTNYDFLTQSVRYYTSNCTTNFTINIRGNSSTSLNSVMSVGQTATMVLMVTNGSTAYYPSTVQIDGTTVTPKYQGGFAVSSGSTNAVDVYTIAIVKTADNTFTSFVSQTKFA